VHVARDWLSVNRSCPWLLGDVSDVDFDPIATFGRADIALRRGPNALLYIELGHTSPLKFAVNLGSMPGTDWMAVPYGSEKAFVFRAGKKLV
jgi:hypothetical protein